MTKKSQDGKSQDEKVPRRKVPRRKVPRREVARRKVPRRKVPWRLADIEHESAKCGPRANQLTAGRTYLVLRGPELGPRARLCRPPDIEDT